MSCCVTALGYGLLIYLVGRALTILYKIVYPFFIYPGIPHLERYTKGKWAVVTGSTDGIGKGYAFELARKNMNLVLIARNPDKLAAVKQEIHEKYSSVEIKTVKFDFTANTAEQYNEMYESNQLDQLDVGILVNNVGVSYEYPKSIEELTHNEITNHIHCNMLSLVMMMHLFVGKMKANKAGAIINVSSFSALFPLPLLSIYGASKIFVHYLTRAIQAELQQDGIICQTVVPMYVATNLSKIRRTSFFIPNNMTFAKSAVRTLGIQEVTTGYWTHQILNEILDLIPSWFLTKIGMTSMLNVRKAALRKLAKAK